MRIQKNVGYSVSEQDQVLEAQQQVLHEVLPAKREMGDTMRSKPTLAMILAIVALFAAMGIVASSYADEDEGGSWTPEERALFRSRQSPLPLQAAVCDIIGIGMVEGVSTNEWGEVAHVAVDNYWLGNPGSNTLSVSANRSALRLGFSKQHVLWIALGDCR